MTSGFVRNRLRLEWLIAFLAGFFMAFVTLLSYDRFLIWSVQSEQHTTAGQYYQTGYMTALQDIETAESSFTGQKLEKELRILCMVFTCPKYHERRAVHIKATWGRRCTKLIFISSALHETLNAIPIVDEYGDSYFKLWNKTREAFRYAYENYLEDFDWFLKADDDTYIVMENLQYMLYPYETDIPIYFGYKMSRYEVEYMSGGSSYVLSREALRRFMQSSYSNTTNCPTSSLLGPEDFYMGICLRNVGVLLADSRFSGNYDRKSKFLPLGLSAYFEPEWNITIPDWFLTMSTEPVELGLDCCSNYTVAFHYADPAQIYTYEFLIYHFQAFRLRRPFAKLPEAFPKQNVYNEFAYNYGPINYEESQKLFDNF